MRRNLILLFSCVFLLSGCELIDYHPYDVRIKGETGINAKNIKRIEQSCKGKTTIRFAVMGDSQRWYDETADFVADLNKKSDVDFVIHGGDISDFGITSEFMWQRDIMNRLNVPYVVLIGNHDCLGTGEDAYAEIFGDDNFAFIAGDVKFVCLNTNAIEYDYSHPIPDFQFIEKHFTDRADEFTKTVYSMHVRPLGEEFNNNVAQVFQHYTTSAPNLLFCTNAHAHSLTADDVFGDGIIYYGSDCMKSRSYLLFTITPDKYEYEVVYY